MSDPYHEHEDRLLLEEHALYPERFTKIHIMNKHDAARYLPIVQALADGKKIQINIGCPDKPMWRDSDDAALTWPPECYRVKPQPREWKMVCHSDGFIDFDTRGPAAPRGEVIRVREILD